MQPQLQSTDFNTNPAVNLDKINLNLPVEFGGEVHILKDVSLQLPAATQCGLVGPSGSGKTSLLTIIAGLRRPSSGRITILGQDLNACNEEQLATLRRDQIGVVFQNFHLLPAMTALENVAMPLELANSEEAEDQARKALELVDLGHRLQHFPHQMSGGEQQRTAIARAFVARPQLVLADEPTGNLDGKTSMRVMEILEQMTHENSATLLLITHNEALLKNTSQVLRLQDGQLATL